MKVKLKRTAFLKNGKCNGTVKRGGKSRRRTCYHPVKVK